MSKSLLGFAKIKSRKTKAIDVAIGAVDAGHGGLLLRQIYTTMGKQFKGFYEGEHNRQFAFHLSNALYENDVIGLELLENTPVDVCLKDRIKTLNLLARHRNNCISYSVHGNAAGKGKDWNPAHGSTIFYKRFDKESKKLAECVSARIDTDALPITHRGIKPTSRFGMVVKPNMPSILHETHFFTNKADVVAYKAYRQLYAALCAQGVGDYFAQRT